MIWCVEDDAAIRDIELYALQSTGFEARGFEDGTAFWEALQREKPDLVVLDVMLPGLDGVELLRKIRGDSRLGDLPVIMATAKGAEYDKIQSLDLGADDYVVKPFGVLLNALCQVHAPVPATFLQYRSNIYSKSDYTTPHKKMPEAKASGMHITPRRPAYAR